MAALFYFLKLSADCNILNVQNGYMLTREQDLAVGKHQYEVFGQNW